MAGERLGRIYEAFVFVCAVTALKTHNLRIPVIWNPRDTDLMVDPDIIIGNSNSPEAILLITRSGARRNWHQKFWRNVGEVVDIRGRYPDARIINVGLGTEVKEELMEVLSLLVDGNIFPTYKVRDDVEQWMRTVAKHKLTKGQSIEEFIESELPNAPKTVKELVTDFGATISYILKSRTFSWADVGIWLTGRRKLATKVASKWGHAGALRRGLAKLLVLGEPVIVLKSIDNNYKCSEVLGVTMARFGWASKAITGWRVSDPEVISVLKMFDRETIVAILSRSVTDELRSICVDVSSEAWIEATCTFLRENRNLFVDTSRLANLLKLSQTDSTLGRIKAVPPSGLTGSWLFRVLISVIKQSSGLKQGFGYEQLIGDIRDIIKDEAIAAKFVKLGASEDKLRRAGSTDSLRRKLVDWVSGLREGTLSDWEILLISSVLSIRISEINPQTYINACSELPAYIRRLTYEDRIAPYRFFEPLRAVIEISLEKAKIPYKYYPRYETLVSMASTSSRVPGTTPVIVSGAAIIHWKSAHGSHTRDKTKELCGRGFCIRHRLDISSNSPHHVSEIKHQILVLDGDFDSDDVEHLVTAGWDSVIRPNNMEELVSALIKE